ncbi:MAG: D-aminoacyl-tRNA deacylase [Pyrinomonadaceae bacterium]
MRAVVQRVTRAKVTIEGETVGEIQKGLVVLLGVARDDAEIDAAAPEVAEPLYDFFCNEIRKELDEVATGGFRHMMQVELVNDGPVTILTIAGNCFNFAL